MMSNTYFVDVPDARDAESPWINCSDFETKEEAIQFARHHFGADENGCICLISEVEDE